MRFEIPSPYVLALAFFLIGSGWSTRAEAQEKRAPSDRYVLSTLDGRAGATASQLRDLVAPAAPSEAQRLMPALSVEGATSNGAYGSGDPRNTTVLLPIGAGNALIGIGWEVSIEATAPSFLSEARVAFVSAAGDDSGLFLTVGDGDDVSGSANYSSGGTVILADAGVPDVPAGPDGTLYVEWYESFDDESVDPDASWSDLTAGALPPGLRLLCTDQAACDAAVGGGGELPVPTGLRVENAEGGLTLTWVPVSAPDLAGYHVYRATAPFATPGAATRLTSTPEDDADFDDATVSAGVTYYYRVTSVDGAGQESGLSNQASGTRRPAAVNASIALAFGNAEQQQNYRLVALPGQAGLGLAATVTGSSPDNWRAFRETGASGGDEFGRAECGAGASCRFDPGAGFWLLADSPWEVNGSFPIVALTSGGSYDIPVRQGWNAISNPLEVDVPWQRVVDANGLSANQELYRWNGAWQTSGTFASASNGQAFYFLNTDANRTSLSIPLVAARPAGDRREPPSEASAPSAFELALAARLGGVEVARATASASARATEDLDAYDRFAPPGYFEPVGLAFVNDALPASHRRLRRDARPAGAEGHSFDLVVTAEPGEAVELVPRMTPGAYEAVLVEPVSGARHALTSGVPIRLQSSSAATRYELRVGPRAFVHANGTAPGEVEVGSYPNPFAAATTIRYGLPEASRVRVTVYDLLGKRVATLVESEEREAGYHAAVWDPQGLASGVYVYVLEAGTRRLTGKLSLVR